VISSLFVRLISLSGFFTIVIGFGCWIESSPSFRL
jgi:hypothetical protein